MNGKDIDAKQTGQDCAPKVCNDLWQYWQPDCTDNSFMALGADIISVTPVYDSPFLGLHMLYSSPDLPVKSWYEALTHIASHPTLSNAYSSVPIYVKPVTPMDLSPSTMLPPSPGLPSESFYETLTRIASPASLSNAYSSGPIYDTPLTVGLPKSKIDQMPIYATPSFGSPVHYNSSLSTPPSHISKPKIEQMPIYATPSVGIPSSPIYDDTCRTPVPSVQKL